MPGGVIDTKVTLHRITIYYVLIQGGTNLVTIPLLLLINLLQDLLGEKPICPIK
jgi:hypothetical protein